MTKSSNASPFQGVVNSFRDMTLREKVGSVALLAVMACVFVYLVTSLLPGASRTEEKVDDVPPPVSAPEPSPSAPAPTLTPGVPETNRPVVAGVEIPKIEGNKLTTEQAREVIPFAEAGVKEFINWPVKETASDRQKRVSAHFIKDSVTSLQAPNLEGLATSWMDEETNRSSYATVGTVNSAHVVGGDTDRFRLNIGAILRLQQMDTTTGKPATGVNENSVSYTVDMRQQGDSWKIIDIYSE